MKREQDKTLALVPTSTTVSAFYPPQNLFDTAEKDKKKKKLPFLFHHKLYGKRQMIKKIFFSGAGPKYPLQFRAITIKEISTKHKKDNALLPFLLP